MSTQILHRDGLRRSLLIGGMVTALLAGCSTDAASFDSTTAAASASGTSGTTATNASNTTSSNTSQLDQTDVQAQISYDVEFRDGIYGKDAEAGLTVGVHSVEYDGKTMVVELYVTPIFTGGDVDENWKLYDLAHTGLAAWAPRLYDRINLKRYSVIEGEYIYELETDVLETYVSDGETTLWRGRFAQPEDDVDYLYLQPHENGPELKIEVP